MGSSRLGHHTPDYDATSVGNFGLAYHLEMVSDAERVGRCKAALDEVLTEDMIHCELGIGTGIFVIHAARRCKKVYAIEIDPVIYEFAKKNIENAGVADKVELILGDATQIQLPEKVDCVFSETLSIWCVNEPQVHIMNHAVQHFLKPGGAVMPQKIINMVELGNYDYTYHDIQILASVAQFSGIKPPRIMTRSEVVNIIDFTQVNELSVDKTIPLESLCSGVINCARLSSLVQRSDTVTFYSTDTLMPLTIVPLDVQKHVVAGDTVSFTTQFTYRNTIDDSTFTIE